MVWRILFGSFCLLCASGPSIPLRAQAPAEPEASDPLAGLAVLDREALVAAVLERNPTLEAARLALAAATERPAQAGALDDLSVSYALAPGSIASSRVDFGQQLTVGQSFPHPGKRRLRADISAAEVEELSADADTLALELASRAGLLFADYYLLARALEINQEHVVLVEDLKRVATARYAAGLAAQQDPLTAEAELAHLVHEEVLLESERDVLAADINALLHRPAAAPLPPPPDQIEVPEPSEAATELLAEARATRPELVAREAAIAAREAALDLARREGRPDFDVMASYNSMWSESQHQFMVGGGVSLPVWRRRIRAGIAEAQAELERARRELTAVEDEVERDVVQASVRLREAHHVLDVLSSRLLPPARDRVEAALAGFRTGKNDFLALIDAERDLRGVRLDLHRAVADLERQRTLLERATGRLPPPPSTTSTLSAPGENP